jgi:hypothetical protein
MPNIEDNNKPMQINPIGKQLQKPQEPAEVPAPSNNEKNAPPETDLRNDPLAIIGRSAVNKDPLSPETKGNIKKDLATLDEFLAENQDFADFLLDLRDEINNTSSTRA